MSSWVVRSGTGHAVALTAGQSVRITNTHGGQVVDAWAVVPPEGAEHMSMEHTRLHLSRLVPREGDNLYSDRRRALLSLVKDTSPGVHDTLMAACDAERYRLLGVGAEHANCAQNFRGALQRVGLARSVVPAPLNLFMNVPWSPDGGLELLPAVARPGDYVTLEALVEVIVVVSVCPMDVNPINGHRLADIELEIEAPAAPSTRASP
jgi:uncharacterized protein